MRKLFIFLIIIVGCLVIYFNIIKGEGSYTVIDDWHYILPIGSPEYGESKDTLQKQIDFVADSLDYKIDYIVESNRSLSPQEYSELKRSMSHLLPFWIKKIEVKHTESKLVDRDLPRSSVRKLSKQENDILFKTRVLDVYAKAFVLPNDANPYKLKCRIESQEQRVGATITIDYETYGNCFVSLFMLKNLSEMKILESNADGIGATVYTLPEDIKKGNPEILVIAHKGKLALSLEEKYISNHGNGDKISIYKLLELVRKKKLYSFKAIPIKVFSDE